MDVKPLLQGVAESGAAFSSKMEALTSFVVADSSGLNVLFLRRFGTLVRLGFSVRARVKASVPVTARAHAQHAGSRMARRAYLIWGLTVVVAAAGLAVTLLAGPVIQAVVVGDMMQLAVISPIALVLFAVVSGLSTIIAYLAGAT